MAQNVLTLNGGSMTKTQANKLAMRLYRQGKVVVMYREALTYRCSGYSYRVEVVK